MLIVPDALKITGNYCHYTVKFSKYEKRENKMTATAINIDKNYRKK
ncbi:hypothetical protein NIES73_19160 [Sphaerospermopsis kisseleviana NIES-73]|nr:hypothetical protein NIES73_19160 [Sphaerospermopsis kisseleviana NIES-73]